MELKEDKELEINQIKETKEVEELNAIEKITDSFEIPNNEKERDIILKFLSSKTSNILYLLLKDLFLEKFILKNLTGNISKEVFIYSASDLIKTNKSIENIIRKSSKFIINKMKYFCEGEVTKISGESDKSYEITLMTQKESKILKLPFYYSKLIENIKVGDYIYSEPSVGILKKIGRSERKMNEFDLEAKRYIPVKKGCVFGSKLNEYYISLYDLDLAYNKQPLSNMNNKNEDITFYTREKVDEFIMENINNSKKDSNGGMIFFKESLIIIKGAEELREVDFQIINKYSTVYNNFKFLLIGGNNENVFSNSEDSKGSLLSLLNVLVLPLSGEIDLIEKLRFLTGKANEKEYLEGIDGKLTEENLILVSKLMELSENSKDFINKASMFL